MKKSPVGFFAALALLCGFAVAQDATPTASSPATPQAQQNSAPTQSAPTSSPQANPAQAGAPATSATTAAANSAAPSNKIAPGSVLPVQLTKAIDAKKLKTGDPVEAKVTQDMKANDGDVIVPKDTKIIGRVTEAQARNKEQKESQVAIAFDHAVMKSGGDVSLPMSIQAIIAPSYLNPNNNPGDSAGQSSSAASGNGMSQSNGNTRGAGMGGSQSSTPSPNAGATAAPADDKSAKVAHEPITGNTQGVLGIPDMTLSSANPTQGSVITSEKNNVKLESGTLMLLKVTGSSQ
jgi:hypothetical protein